MPFLDRNQNILGWEVPLPYPACLPWSLNSVSLPLVCVTSISLDTWSVLGQVALSAVYMCTAVLCWWTQMVSSP